MTVTGDGPNDPETPDHRVAGTVTGNVKEESKVAVDYTIILADDDGSH